MVFVVSVPIPIPRVNIFSMFRFLETDIREQKTYEKRMQTSVDNIVNGLLFY